ncbi:nuclear cap-binding protein complex subunit 1 [[Candida] anglica]|uniref:Nuclear cap-binding protein complex subunit 1 n=1 Tax=[Candida] anglica TaxID=148631 RepID=A0ABP0EMI5_9ASCO
MDSYPPNNKRSRDEFDGGSGAGGPPPFSHDGHNNGHDDGLAKRQHVDPTTELIANVCKDIRRIGENSNLATQVDDISYISNPIVAEFEKIDKLRISILNTLYSVVIEQPQKINSLSVLILLCNPKNFLVAKYVIEFFHSKAQGLIDTLFEESKKEQTEGEKEGEKEESASTLPPQEQQELEEYAGSFNNLKSILKFLACLSPIISNYSIVDVFKQFLKLSIELQDSTPEVRNGLAEEIYYNTLVSLPYLLCNDFSSTMKDHCNDLLALASDFKHKDNVSYTSKVFEPFNLKGSNFSDNLPYKPKNIISLIYPALLTLQGENKLWDNLKDKLFIDFEELITPIIAKSLENNQLSNEIVKHQLPQLSLPTVEKLNAEYKPKGLVDTLWFNTPRLLFQVYNITTEFETVPSIESYVGLFFKDLSFDILTNLSFNKNEASIQLSILDLYFSKNLFAPPGSPIDQLTLINQDNLSGENQPPLSTWKIEDIAIESILTMIFQLPIPLHVEVYYYSVLISCCRESPDSIAPVFGRAIRYFYNNLEVLDYELKIRFLDWMSIQISNFEFSWKWDEWVKDSKQFKNLKYHPKKNFIKNLIAKEIRLSNKNRIKESFVTVNVNENGGNSIVQLDEFYQYLNLSLVENEEDFILNYDSELFGNSDEIKEIFQTLSNQTKEKRLARLESSTTASISPQEELIYNFSLPTVPLNEIANTVYDFVVANWKSNSDFQDLCQGVLTSAEEKLGENAIKERYLINLIFQTYVYIGSRSIFSAVSIFSRDVVKLRYLAGWNLEDDEYKNDPSGFKFTPLELTEEQFNQRQTWITEAIFRVWNHQPQVAFLILEYLIDFKILKPIVLIEYAFAIKNNLIIENVSCMESINRVLINLSKKDSTIINDLLIKIFEFICSNLNIISNQLNIPNTEEVTIIKEFEESDIENLELMSKIDNQWLFYEYLGLLKSYLRRYYSNLNVSLEETTKIFEKIENEKVKQDVLSWLDELK